MEKKLNKFMVLFRVGGGYNDGKPLEGWQEVETEESKERLLQHSHVQAVKEIEQEVVEEVVEPKVESKKAPINKKK